MKKKNTKLYDLVNVDKPKEVHNEIKYIISLMTDNYDYDYLFADTVKLFNGGYPGYQASKTKYHDLGHTHSVVLATARIMHGCYIDGKVLTPREIFLGIAASLFHDIGLIQTEVDTVGTGAKYTVGHEERSINFMSEYLSSKSFSSDVIQDCSHLIRSTILSLPIKEIPFHSKEIETLGKIIGSADLIAQIADRNYLEKLLMLFKEFEEANIPGYSSKLELLQKTEDFYTFVAKKRLLEEFGGISASMIFHFKHRWNINRDLYEEAMINNIEYLKSLVCECKDKFDCYLDNLRRLDLSK